MQYQKNTENGNEFSSVFLLHIFLRWYKKLIIIIVVAFIISAVVSLLIPPRYQSKVILFPASTHSISKALMSDFYGPKADIMEFGEEEQAERMLQILNSGKIREKIVEKYDLYSHYNIHPESKYRRAKLISEYNKNIRFNRTKYMAVEISVFDRDAQMAADIANDIAVLFDTVINQMQKERAIKSLEIIENTYFSLMREILRLEDSLVWLRDRGVYDYESQSERIIETLSKELAHGNTRGIKLLQNQLDTLAKYGGSYVSIRDALTHEKKQLTEIKLMYEKAKIDAEEFIPHKFVVDTAYKAEKKTYPKRMIIVLVSVISTFLAAIVFISIYENIKYKSLKKLNYE